MFVESGMPSDDATIKSAYRREQMTLAFPDAMVTGFEALITAMTNDLKDRHVLAAAVRANASTIVTANLADFPDSSTSPYAIEVKHPDLFLMDLLGFDANLVLEALSEVTAQKKRPPMTQLDMLRRIAKSAPRFAAAVLIQLES